MRILTCIKYVPDPTEEVEFGPDRTLPRESGSGMLSELDEYAIEQALVLRQQFPDATVTALSVGPEPAAAALRKALQMGADEAVLVSDQAIHGSDVFATATVIAAAVSKLDDVGLLICGMGSTDAGTGALPALLSHQLDWALLSLAAQVEFEGDRLRIERVDESGQRRAEASLPAVVSVTDQSGTPRYRASRT